MTLLATSSGGQAAYQSTAKKWHTIPSERRRARRSGRTGGNQRRGWRCSRFPLPEKARDLWLKRCQTWRTGTTVNLRCASITRAHGGNNQRINAPQARA